MSRLFSLEWHKLVTNKTFYLWTVISAAFSVLCFLIPQLLRKGDINNALSVGISAVVSSPICICFEFFICGFICLDFENGFMKNIISKGYKRSTIFASKYFITLLASAIMVVVNYIVCVAVIVAFFGAKVQVNGIVISQIILMLVGLSAFCEIAYLLCVIFKKQGPVIGINVLLILLVGTGITFLKPLLKINFDIGSLWILDSIGSGTALKSTLGLIIAGFVCTLCYLVGTYIATMRSVKHLEV